MKVKRVIGVVFLVIALIGVILIALDQSNMAEAAPPTVIFGGLGLILMIPKSKIKTEFEKTVAAKRAVEEDRKERLRITKSGLMEHMCGLSDVPEGAICQICLCENQYAFIRNGLEYTLPFEKVIDVSVKTETEIRNSYVSSIGGAIGGAALFGTLGAMVGGRAKKKTDKIIHQYLIFAFQKQEETAFLSFDCTNQSNLAFLCQRAFENKEHSRRTIEL